MPKLELKIRRECEYMCSQPKNQIKNENNKNAYNFFTQINLEKVQCSILYA